MPAAAPAAGGRAGRRQSRWLDLAARRHELVDGDMRSQLAAHAGQSSAEGLPTDPRVQAAIKIQYVFRLQIAAYRHYGGDLFCMKDGTPARHGTLSFVDSFAARPARFLVFSSTTSSAVLDHFLTRHWRLAQPEIIISVTGSAQDFKLPPQLQAAFSEGLASASKSCRECCTL